MPKLVDESTGEVLKDDLTKGELEELESEGVDFDLPEADDVDGDATSIDEADDDEVPDSLVETELPESPEAVEASRGESDDDAETPDDPPDIVGGEIDHHIAEEFAERDEEHIEAEHDVKLDEIDKVDERDRARWANLIKQLDEYDTDIKARKRDRDKMIEKNSWRDGRDHASLRTQAENNGIISELKDGFRQMVSRPTPQPSLQGPQVDPMNVARRAAGDMTVRELFEEYVETETGDRCIGIATDVSGSMGDQIDLLKIAGGAIAEATDIVGDDFVWEAFDDRASDGLNLQIVKAPDEDWDWEYVDSIGAGGNEPTAAGIRDCRTLMEETDAREYIMLVITDGMALVNEDGDYLGSSSNEPVEHARQAVRECRQDDINVMGMGIGSMDDRKMRETFGAGNYQLSSIDQLAHDVLDFYASHMSVSR